LTRALNSVAEQTYKDFEVIVSDDGSTDATAEIVLNFSSLMDITYLRQENWGGPARPRNLGLSVAKGQWVCFLDADDWWYPEKLATVFPFTGNADIIHHDCDVFDINGKKFLKMRGRQLNKPVFVDLLTGWNALHTSTVCVRKSILDVVGLFSEEKALIAVEDFDLWIRIARFTDKFAHISNALGAYWLSQGNISSFSMESIEREAAVHMRYVGYLDPEDRIEAVKMLSYRKGLINWHLENYAQSRQMFIASLRSRRLRTRLLAPLWVGINVMVDRFDTVRWTLKKILY